MLKSLTKSVFSWMFEEYRINWIVGSQADRAASSDDAVQLLGRKELAQIKISSTYKIRNAASFNASGLKGYVLMVGEQPAAVAHFAEPRHYDRASTWPLGPDEVALMDIATEEGMRGQGIAARLINGAEHHYRSLGAQRLIAFIWWSNTPSLRAFHKAGWKRIGLSLEAKVQGRWRAIRIPLSNYSIVSNR